MNQNLLKMEFNVEQLKSELEKLKNQLQAISKEEVGRSFNDNIHGLNTTLPPIIWKLIDTPIYQRLRYVHQLGTMSLVFPNATHSRFEHSLGVAYLAGQWMKHFRRIQPELNISEREIHLVQIAGLFHDLGHGPFSHAFESGFVQRLNPNLYRTDWEHEEASVALTKIILNEYNQFNQDYPFTENEIKMVQDCIDGKYQDKGEKSYQYQIVANKINSIDVDKFDYLKRDTSCIGMSLMFSMERLMKFSRVIDGNICFRIGQEENILMMFVSRFNLHKQIYTHKVVVALDKMVGDILRLADPVLHLSDLFRKDKEIDYYKYIELDDSILRRIEIDTNPGLDKAKKLLEKLRRRQLYKWVARCKVDKNEIESNVKFIEQILSEDYSMIVNDEPQFIVTIQKFNFALKDKNPLETVWYYKDDEPNKKFKIDHSEVLELMPKKYLYCYADVYVKSRKLVNVAAKLLENTKNITFSPKVKSPFIEKQNNSPCIEKHNNPDQDCQTPDTKLNRNLFA